MAKDWEDLSGEKGRAVPTGRWSRLFKVGRLGLSVAGGAASQAIKRRLVGRDGELNAFHSKQAQKILETLGEMKGAVMKVGQILSTDPDLVPTEFADVLAKLQRDAPPMTYIQVRDVIEGALDRPIEDLFSYFDPDPIGAASIGQVHKGRLKDGRVVAIKVQYPGVAESIESDLRNLSSLVVLARPLVDRARLDSFVEECRQTLVLEADYVAEARNLLRFAELLEGRKGVVSPLPVQEWTRTSVLMMDYMEGVKLDEALGAMECPDAKRELARRWLGCYAWMCHELFELHSDPHPGNFLVQDSGDLVFLDFGCVRTLEPAFMDGLLRILKACWADDYELVAQIYVELGFAGKRGKPTDIPTQQLRTYHRMLLEPFFYDGDFKFDEWELHGPMRRFMLSHPNMLHMTPPAQLMMPARVMGGVKGLLTRFGIDLNVREVAEEVIAARLGL